MNVFVTGATGVLGRRVVRDLVQSGHDVRAVARSEQKTAMLTGYGARPVAVDLFDTTSVQKAVEGQDVVINLATHIPSTLRAFLPGAWHENDRIRSEASQILVDAAIRAGVKRFIQESFAPMYADQGDKWITENSPVNPRKHHLSALAAERQAYRFTENGGVGIVLRFGYFYSSDSEHTVDMIRSVERGWAPAFGNPDGYFSSIHVDDAARAVAAVMTASAGTYNVVDDPVSKREFSEVASEALGVAPPRYPPRFAVRLGGPVIEALARSLRISNQRLREETEWSPAYPSVREGLPSVIAEVRSFSKGDKVLK